MVQLPPFTLIQFCWMRNFMPPATTLYFEPLLAPKVVPNVQAHLSPFSDGEVELVQALTSGSLTVSSSSCDMTLTMASATTLLLGDTVWLVDGMHDAGQRLGSPMNANLMSAPSMLAWLW